MVDIQPTVVSSHLHHTAKKLREERVIDRECEDKLSL